MQHRTTVTQSKSDLLLSVLIPVYNECRTLGTILTIVAHCSPNINKEVIIIDDCSTDGTREWLKVNFPEGERHASTVDLDDDGNLAFAEAGSPCIAIRTVYHEFNEGKGGALQTG